ncbi:MAG: ABC transporter permease [Planctomycetota bacterium]
MQSLIHPQRGERSNALEPEVLYTADPSMRHPVKLLRAIVRDFRQCRTLAWRLFIRDLRARYRESYLGYAWAFLPILVTTSIFVFLRSSGSVRFDETPVPYPAFALIGMVLWQTFVDALQIPLRSVRAARTMLTKINFPREALLLSAIGEVLFNLVVRLLLLLAVLLWFQIVPPATVLLMPIGVAGLIALGLILSLFLMPISLLYTDVSKGLPLVTMAMLFLTPVLYPVPTSGIGERLARFNPASLFLQPTRDCLTTGQVLGLPQFALLAGVIAVSMVWGLMVYRVSMPHVIARMES